MQSPQTPGAILYYDRAFRDESLLRIKDRKMGEMREFESDARGQTEHRME